MRLIGHIIWKDIRAERWGLLFWATLYIAQIIFGLTVFHHDQVDRDFVDAITIASVLMVAAQFFMGYVLIVRLVQSDAVTGTRMFWLTRPIPTARLARAKGWGTLLIFGLGPVLLQLPWWLYCGFAASDVGWAALETFGWQMLLMAPALMIASLTDDFGRALMWGLLLVLVVVGTTIFLYTRSFYAAMVAVSSLRYGGLLFTRFWLSAFLLIGGSLIVVAHQFQTRRTVRSIVLAGPMVVAALVAGRFWPVDCAGIFALMNEPDPIPAAAPDAYPDLQLTLGTAETQEKEKTEYYGISRKPTPKTWVKQTAEMRGVPEAMSFGNIRLRHSWRWPGDVEPVSSDTFYLSNWSWNELRRILALPAWAGDTETVRWQDEKYRERVARGQPSLMSAGVFWQAQDSVRREPYKLVGRSLVRDSIVDRIRAQAPASEVRVTLELAHPYVLFELPLKPGAIWSGASRAYRVGPWGEREDNRATVQLLTARPAVREAGLWSVEVMDRGIRDHSSRNEDFVAVNRSNNTFGSTRPSGNTARSGKIVIGGVLLQWNTLNVYTTRVIRNDKWVIYDPDWSEHTSLAMVVPGQVTRLTRDLKVEKFELRPGEAAEAPPAAEKKKTPAI